MEKRIVVSATGSSAWSVRLMQVVGILYYILGATLGFDTADVATEASRQVSLLLFALAFALDASVFSIVV